MCKLKKVVNLLALRIPSNFSSCQSAISAAQFLIGKTSFAVQDKKVYPFCDRDSRPEIISGCIFSLFLTVSLCAFRTTSYDTCLHLGERTFKLKVSMEQWRAIWKRSARPRMCRRISGCFTEESLVKMLKMPHRRCAAAKNCVLRKFFF